MGQTNAAMRQSLVLKLPMRQTFYRIPKVVQRLERASERVALSQRLPGCVVSSQQSGMSFDVDPALT